MTLWTKKGTITKDTTTGVHDQVFSGITSEAPKVLFIWGNACTALDTYTDGYQQSFGYSDGTVSCCNAQCNQDNQASMNSWTEIRNDAIVAILDPTQTATGADLARATVKTLDSTGFTLTWNVANDVQYILHYLAIGGSDITNVKCQALTAGQTGTGNRNYTGFGFQPDFVVVLGTNENITSYNSITAGGTISIGAAVDATAGKQFCFETKIRDGAGTNDTNLRISNNTVQTGSGTATSDAIVNQADFVSFISDGVTLNIATAYANANVPLSFLCIKGGFWDVDTTINPAIATGTQDYNITAGRDPEGVMMFNAGNGTYNNILGFIRLSIGASDGTDSGSAFVGDVSGSDPMVTVQRTTTTNIVEYHLPNATASSSTLEKAAIMSDMATVGKFVLDWTTADATGRRAAFFSVSKVSVTQTSIHKYNILNNVSQTSIHKYDIAQSVQSVSQTNIHKYDLLENILQSNIHKYDINSEVLQVSIQKYNILENILQSTIQKYNILNDIIQTSIHKYNIIQEILSQSVHKYNNIQEIVSDSIQKYDILTDIIADNIQKYNILANITETSVHKYHLLQQILSDSIHKYDIIQSILATNIHKYDIIQQISQTSIHIYDIIVEGTVQTTNIMKYDILQYITNENIHKYNILNIIAQESIHTYNIFQNVLQSTIHSYNILQYIISSGIHKYNLLQETIQSNIHKYNILQNVAETSTHIYNILGILFVTAHNIHKYDIKSLIVSTTIHKYKILTKRLISVFGAGAKIELESASRTLQDAVRSLWPI